jgi:hypothetical protein
MKDDEDKNDGILQVVAAGLNNESPGNQNG